MMKKHVEFPKFVDGLHAAGADVPAVRFLKAPQDTWRQLPGDVRRLILRALGFGNLDPDAVQVSLGKKPGAPKRLQNVVVILRATAAPAAEGKGKAAAPAEEHLSLPQAEAVTLALPSPEEAEPPATGGELVALDDEDERLALALLEDGDEEPLELGPVDVDEPVPVEGVESEPEAVPAIDAEPEEPLALEAAAEAAPAKKSGMSNLFRKKQGAEVDEEDAEPGTAEQSSGAAVTVIPPLAGPHLREVEVYPVQEPYAFVRIVHDDEAQEHLYEVIEPALSEREQNVLEFIEDTLVDVIEIGAAEIGPDEAASLLRKHVDEIIYDYSVVLSPVAKEKLLYYILRDFLGFGILDPIMRDEMIEDVSCDGPKIPIFLYHRRYESLKSLTLFPTDDECDSFVIRMAQRSGKHISIAEPLLDATLPDGSRLNATLSDEVTANGSTFTIRKFKDDPFTAPDLVRFGTMSADILAYWWLGVQNGASAIYAGGTASGKTTSLNAILLFIPPQMKIVSIEDTREINLPHLNWIPGVTRSGFGPRDNHGRQAGEIDMFTLLKAALRQRPEYILVGEVRGAEAYALFQAMATGHTAYGTMHADSVEAVIHRLESEPISIPRSLLEALDIVSIQIQTRIGDKRVRRTKEIVEVVGLDPHTREILTNEVFNWDPATDTFEYSGVSYVLERIMMERNMSETQMREEFARRKEVIQLMVELELRDYRDVAKAIVNYYKDPLGVLERLREMRKERFGEAAPEVAPLLAVAPAMDEPVEEVLDAMDDIPDEPEVEDAAPEEVPWAQAVPWEREADGEGGSRWRVIEGLPEPAAADADLDEEELVAGDDFEALDDAELTDALGEGEETLALAAGGRRRRTILTMDGAEEVEEEVVAAGPAVPPVEGEAGPDEGRADEADGFTRPLGLAVPESADDADADEADDGADAEATAPGGRRGRKSRSGDD